jgi:hypothetical protein
MVEHEGTSRAAPRSLTDLQWLTPAVTGPSPDAALGAFVVARDLVNDQELCRIAERPATLRTGRTESRLWLNQERGPRAWG